MPDWVGQFQEHDVFQKVRAVGDLLDSTRVFAEEADIDAADTHGRVAHIVSTIARRLASADPLAITFGHLNNVATQLGKVQQELENFRANLSVAHLTQAMGFAEAALAQAMFIVPLRDDADIQGVQEAVVSFRRSLGQHLRHVEEQVGAASAETAKVREQAATQSQELQQLKARMDEAISRIESQFSQAEAERRRESQAAVSKLQEVATDLQQRGDKLLGDIEQRAAQASTDLEARNVKLLGDVEERFQRAQEARTSKFDQLLSEQRDASTEALSALDEEHTKQAERADEAFTAFRTRLEEHKEEVENLVGAIAQTGMVAGYQRVANEEKRAMRLWQTLTVLSMIGFVLFMLAIMPEPGAAFSWPSFAGRALAALGLAALAAYASRESAKHGEKERMLRQFELEIASIGPFLATIPKEDQDALKKTIADRAFGRGTQPLLVEAPATTNGVIEVLRFAIEQLGRK